MSYTKGKYTVKLALTWNDDILKGYKRTVMLGDVTVFSDNEDNSEEGSEA
ncbi:MAG: hypothetical protein IJ446_07550 [Oscillospiraceae bacterium]|nr:hypothetical protein [Oscillospiraceae bacterium]